MFAPVVGSVNRALKFVWRLYEYMGAEVALIVPCDVVLSDAVVTFPTVVALPMRVRRAGAD